MQLKFFFNVKIKVRIILIEHKWRKNDTADN